MADHLTIEELLLASGGEAGTGAESHLAACAECRARLGEMRQGIDEYTSYHHSTLRMTMPPPPRPWRELPAPVRAPHVMPSRRVYGWIAAAAAIVVAVFLLRPSRQATGIDGSQLLARAEAVEGTPARTRRIVLRGSHGTLVRPAVWIRTRGDHPLRARFEQAGYSWDEPLSVRSYNAWRRKLSRKLESVRQARHPKTSEPVYVVTTETDANPLKMAALSLRERDLQPVSATLNFTDGEAVEMDEAPEEARAKPDGRPSTAAPSLPGAPANTHAMSPAMQELQVLTALHGIGADLGEPVQLAHENEKLVLSGSGVSEARREEIQNAVAGLDFVIPRLESSRPKPPSTTRRTEASAASQTGPVRALVEQRLGTAMSFDDFVNDALDASDGVLSRTHALGALATRFPNEVEKDLPAQGRLLLETLRSDHLGAASEHLKRLAKLLTTGFGIDGNATSATRPWHEACVAFRDSTQAFDTILTGMLTGTRKADVDLLRQAFLRMKAEAQTAGVQ